MAQVNLNCVSAPECVEFEIKLENLGEEEEIHEERKVEQKSVKKELLKLIKEAELNARYFEELRPVKTVGTQVYFNKYWVF